MHEQDGTAVVSVALCRPRLADFEADFEAEDRAA
mgnify:CR=1 FL=1